MKPRRENGMVLVACLLVLALLSLLGAGALLTASLDTQLASNQKVNKECFYSAEAALEVGLGRVMNDFRNKLRPYRPTYTWIQPAGGTTDPYANPFNNHTTEFRISNALDANAPASLPTPFVYNTVENNQTLLHYAYTYNIEARAACTLGSSSVTETLRVLETPLVQYYIFFDDDLSWHNGPQMRSWGRVHTNGNLYMCPDGTSAAPNGLLFRNYDDANRPAPNLISVAGQIIYGSRLFEGGAPGARATAAIQVRVHNPGTIPAAAGDYVNITQSITPGNRGVQEPLFRDDGTGSTGSFHVRVGVNRLPAPSYVTLARGQFYETEADSPARPSVDGIKIISDTPGLQIYFTLNGGAQEDVTTQVRNYQVDGAGGLINFPAWPAGAKVRADGSAATTILQLIPRTIVYSPEDYVRTDEVGAAYTAYRGAGRNPRYPCILERRDEREVKEVDLTVIDLQRLEYWYRDKLDRLDNGAVDGSNWDTAVNAQAATSPMNPANRQLLIYASRTNANTQTAGALQGIKLIGSNAGRSRDNTIAATRDRQTSPTLVTRTTLATDNPIYLDGDFNSPSASATVKDPGAYGCAILSDATALLSNEYGRNEYTQNGGARATQAARETTYNAALFSGRFDFRSGGSGEEAGIHNFTRFLENWSGVPCNISGCLINLWFSTQATSQFNLTGAVYDPPQRNFGWDVNFGDSNYWPPYLPSIYSIQRSVWREQGLQ